MFVSIGSRVNNQKTLFKKIINQNTPSHMAQSNPQLKFDRYHGRRDGQWTNIDFMSSVVSHVCRVKYLCTQQCQIIE